MLSCPQLCDDFSLFIYYLSFCNCRSKLVSQLTNGQLKSKCDDTRRTLVCTGLLGKQGNQHHITGYGNESQQCLQSETVN